MEIKTVENERLFADLEGVLGDGGEVVMRVRGHSMRPFLRDGRDAVRLVPTDAAALRTGMVVLFRYRGRHVLHRIRRIEGNRLTIKGDGNYCTTEHTTRGEVAAVVRSVIRGGRDENSPHKEQSGCAGRKQDMRGESEVVYGSARWRWLSFYSLTAKLLRMPWIELKSLIKRALR
jgi:hypothetical protein